MQKSNIFFQCINLQRFWFSRDLRFYLQIKMRKKSTTTDCNQRTHGCQVNKKPQHYKKKHILNIRVDKVLTQLYFSRKIGILCRVPHVEQGLPNLSGAPTFITGFQWDSCCSIFICLYNVSQIIVCPFSLEQGFQSGPVPGTFTRLRSCIVPAEITEPPKISDGQNHKYDGDVEYFS